MVEEAEAVAMVEVVVGMVEASVVGMVEASVVGMVEASAVGMVEASAVEAAILLVAVVISLVAVVILLVAVVISLVEAAISLVAVVISLGIVLPAIASQNTKERTLRGTKIISGTTAISFLEVPLGTEIPIRMIIRITDIMTTMTATITMGNTHQPK